MKEKINAWVAKVKGFWTAQTPKKKNTIIAAGCGVLVGTVLLVLFLQNLGGGYTVLYPGIDATETASVYSSLREMGVPAEINNKGEVMVPQERKDELLLSLAADFPKTAPNYGIYSTNAGFTATESDRRVYLNANLEDMIRQTLESWSAIKRAAVILVVPEESNKIWEEVETPTTASVTLTLMAGQKLTPDQVASVQNLVASSVPKLAPTNVTVIDAVRNQEMPSSLGGDDSAVALLQRSDYERQYEKVLSDKVKTLLSGIYGPGGVQAVATVVFDYDKMLSEEMQYIPEDDGSGIVEHREDKYTVGGNELASGVPGEENNTTPPAAPDTTNPDGTPTYENQTGTGTGAYTDVYKNIDYKISYIKKQIERGEAPLKDATISVMVNDTDFSTEKQDMLLSSISKAVNIPIEKIALTNTWVGTNIDVPASALPAIFQNPVLLIGIGVGLLLLILIVMFVMKKMKKKGGAKVKKGKKGKNGEAEPAPSPVLDPMQEKAKLVAELEEQKKQIRESYGVAALDKDSIISSEVREFTKENPEIAAQLIRTWLKEDEQ